jgi:hypothetical protein
MALGLVGGEVLMLRRVGGCEGFWVVCVEGNMVWVLRGMVWNCRL